MVTLTYDKLTGKLTQTRGACDGGRQQSLLGILRSNITTINQKMKTVKDCKVYNGLNPPDFKYGFFHPFNFNIFKKNSIL